MSITVYSTPTCIYCNMVKKYLESKNIRYSEADNLKDSRAAAEMIEKSGRRECR